MTYLYSTMTNRAERRDELWLAPDGPEADGADREGTAQLTLLLGEVQRQLAAEDLLVAWHDGRHAPVFLFGDGARQPRSDVERDMIKSASEAAQAGCSAQSEWRELDGATPCALLTTSMPAHDGIVTVTTLFARMGANARAHAREGFARLVPLIQPFFWMWSLRRKLAARLKGLTAAVDNTDIGIVLVDRRARMLFANSVAETMIEQEDGLRLSGGLLSGAKLADTLRLRTAIEHALDGGPLRAHAAAPVVALYRRDRRPLLAAIVPTGEGVGDDGEDAAVLYLFDPEQDLCKLIEPACKLYGLSPVEARLTCLLADGLSLADAAERMRVREQTARSYLKQIFGKTQTNRQAELVWLMLKSSVRTAPGCRTSFV